MSNIHENFNNMFSKLESLATSKTVIGEPITLGNVIILPLVDLSFGIGIGSGVHERDANKKEAGGGGGGGVSITPTAVLVVENGNVQLVNIKNQESVNKLIDMAPGILSKVTEWVAKNKENKENKDKEDCDKEL